MNIKNNNLLFAIKILSPFIVFIIFFLFGITLAIYFNPTKENITCNSSYSCNIEREFVNIIKTNKNIQLSKNSTISHKLISSGGGRKGTFAYRLKIKLDSKNIFFEYVDHDKKEEIINNKYNKIKNEFYKYLSQPTNGFSLQSQANSLSCYIMLIVIAIGLIPICLFLAVKSVSLLWKN